MTIHTIFDIGDKVYFVENGKIYCEKVLCIEVRETLSDTYISYFVSSEKRPRYNDYYIHSVIYGAERYYPRTEFDEDELAESPDDLKKQLKEEQTEKFKRELDRIENL